MNFVLEFFKDLPLTDVLRERLALVADKLAESEAREAQLKQRGVDLEVQVRDLQHRNGDQERAIEQLQVRLAAHESTSSVRSLDVDARKRIKREIEALSR